MPELQHVKGFSELSAAMRDLPVQVQRQLMRPAVGAATEVVRKQAEQDAPYFHGSVQLGHPPPGTLKKAIQRKFLGHHGTRTQWITFVRRGKAFRHVKVAMAMFGPLPKGQKRQRLRQIQNQDAYYWFWVNFGTAKMDARPYMTDALPKSSSRAIETMRDTLAKGIQRLKLKGTKR